MGDAGAAAFASLGLLSKGPPGQVLSDKQAYERVAAALGGLAHLLDMLARILGVALRYPLRFGASRSYVLDAVGIQTKRGVVGGGVKNGGPSRGSGPGPPPGERAAEFPLFAEGADETKFSYAVFLLNKVRGAAWQRNLFPLNGFS